jgi:hypothetical protein
MPLGVMEYWSTGVLLRRTRGRRFKYGFLMLTVEFSTLHYSITPLSQIRLHIEAVNGKPHLGNGTTRVNKVGAVHGE